MPNLINSNSKVTTSSSSFGHFKGILTPNYICPACLSSAIHECFFWWIWQSTRGSFVNALVRKPIFKKNPLRNPRGFCPEPVAVCYQAGFRFFGRFPPINLSLATIGLGGNKNLQTIPPIPANDTMSLTCKVILGIHLSQCFVVCKDSEVLFLLSPKGTNFP